MCGRVQGEVQLLPLISCWNKATLPHSQANLRKETGINVILQLVLHLPKLTLQLPEIAVHSDSYTVGDIELIVHGKCTC